MLFLVSRGRSETGAPPFLYGSSQSSEGKRFRSGFTSDASPSMCFMKVRLSVQGRVEDVLTGQTFVIEGGQGSKGDSASPALVMYRE